MVLTDVALADTVLFFVAMVGKLLEEVVLTGNEGVDDWTAEAEVFEAMLVPTDVLILESILVLEDILDT